MRSTRLGTSRSESPYSAAPAIPASSSGSASRAGGGLAQDPRRGRERGDVEQQPLHVLARGLAERRPRRATSPVQAVSAASAASATCAGAVAGQRPRQRDRGRREQQPRGHAGRRPGRVGVAAREAGRRSPGRAAAARRVRRAGAHRARQATRWPAPRLRCPRRAQARPGSPRPAGPAGARPSRSRCSSARARDLGHEDRPARRPGRLPRRRRGRVVADRGPRARPGRPVRRLPVPDGAVLRARARCSASARGSCSGCGSGWCSRSRRGGSVRLMDALAGRPRGAAHLVAGLLFLAQPVRGGVHRAHVGDAARLRRAAVAAAVRVPRAARAALVVVAGGVRARRRLHGRRRQRRGHRLGPARAAAARAYELATRTVGARALLALRLADRAADRARRDLVGDPDARAGAPRRRLPALHRAAGHDLVDDEPARVAAADGLLDLLPRRRLRRAAAAAVRRRRACCCSPGRW